jgi:hypothetical protein
LIGYELEDYRGGDLVRFVRTLGQHRYVASRLHLVHAFAIEAAAAARPAAALAEAADWARRAIGSGVIDLGSRDERLYRRASDAELVAVLEAFWDDGEDGNRAAARAQLEERLAAIGAAPDPTRAAPFDEACEEELFPVLVDAGWELLPLAHLDPSRHRGAIQSFDDFEVARFEEESAIPPLVTLHELPLLGGVELAHAFDADGRGRAPFVLWQQGHAEYLDYVLRGILRAAKLEGGG